MFNRNQKSLKNNVVFFTAKIKRLNSKLYTSQKGNECLLQGKYKLVYKGNISSFTRQINLLRREIYTYVNLYKGNKKGVKQMKTIRIGEEREITGKIMRASAHDYIENKIYGYLLTEEEAEETCYFGYGEYQCSTCKGNDCPYFEERVNGVDEPIDENIVDNE